MKSTIGCIWCVQQLTFFDLEEGIVQRLLAAFLQPLFTHELMGDDLNWLVKREQELLIQLQ